ncbi:MAG TPA: endopeptidase La, partial [Deltaproteobacteria bacterium]|nr:endopeptidase La [Deltaproteobacteria bacterium]
YLVQVQPVDESSFNIDQNKLNKLAKEVRELFKRHVKQGKIKINKDALASFDAADAIQVSDRLISMMELPREQKQQLLETLNPETRLQQ